VALPVPPDTRDPQLRQLRNVIEEVAIAAGVPVPDIYLMETSRASMHSPPGIRHPTPRSA
jgi:hypothetical protein